MMRILAALTAAPLALTLLAQPARAEESTGSPPRQLFDVADLPAGAPPAVPYADRGAGGAWTIHAEGRLTRVTGSLSAFAPMGAGYVLQTNLAGRSITRWVGADGTPSDMSWRGGFGLAVSAAGRAVAFTGPRGAVRVIDSGGDRVLRMPRVPTGSLTSAAGVIGEDCKEDEDSSGCTVYVNSQAKTDSWLTSSHGIVDTTAFDQVSTVRGPWVGGITEVTDVGTCNVMTRASRTKWRTCRNRFSDVSPTNRQVLGLPAYGDGLGPTRLDLLDLRTGDRLRSWVPDRRGTTAIYFDEVWEDPEHVLVVTLQDDRWAIVRLGLDGSMEYAVAPRRGGVNFSSPLRLVTH